METKSAEEIHSFSTGHCGVKADKEKSEDKMENK